MPVTSRTKTSLERLLFRFLWSGSAVNISRHVCPGIRGLGIPDLGIMATAFHVRWTQVALDSVMTLARSLASYFLSTRLRMFSPSANSVPRAGTTSPFYGEAAKTLAKFERFRAHCRSFDLSRHNPNWKLITATFLDASRATFMHKLARGSLPIQYRPFTAGAARGVCREDTVHIFSQCALPAALHRKIASLFGLPGVPYQTVRLLNPLPSRAINQFALLLVECSYQVWLARSDAVFNGRRAGLQEVHAKVLKELWFHFTRESHVLGGKRFLETWHCPTVIFSKTGPTRGDWTTVSLPRSCKTHRHGRPKGRPRGAPRGHVCSVCGDSPRCTKRWPPPPVAAGHAVRNVHFVPCASTTLVRVGPFSLTKTPYSTPSGGGPVGVDVG
ncbi:hypothetical protein HPB50_024876 [Hyalomma asiaticum]|uniref:Uncharacterized protein n=1 Tax=Hyalomma asiaticum TaxID=266040 RepID=A0ACB7SBR8_HYAAI|nr:hypothetical protein HPB50_024876 [Hyalomma asiaticum]